MLAGCGIRLSSIRRVPGLMPSHTVTWVASGGVSPASTNRCRVSSGLHCRAFATPTSTASDGFTSRPCSSQVYPGNADVGEHRHLFPAQTRRAPAAHPGQPQALRIEAFTAGAQKGPQLFASIVRHGDRRLPLRHRGHHPSSIRSANTSIDRNWYPFNLSVMLRRSAE